MNKSFLLLAVALLAATLAGCAHPGDIIDAAAAWMTVNVA